MILSECPCRGSFVRQSCLHLCNLARPAADCGMFARYGVQAMILGWCVSGESMVARAIVKAARSGLLETTLSAVLLERPTTMQVFCEENGVAVSVLSDRAALKGELTRLKAVHGLEWLGLTFDRLLAADEIAIF